LQLRDRDVEQALGFVAEYAYSIFKAQALVLHEEWRILRGQSEASAGRAA